MFFGLFSYFLITLQSRAAQMLLNELDVVLSLSDVSIEFCQMLLSSRHALFGIKTKKMTFLRAEQISFCYYYALRFEAEMINSQ